jgi:hypothetical protein
MTRKWRELAFLSYQLIIEFTFIPYRAEYESVIIWDKYFTQTDKQNCI